MRALEERDFNGGGLHAGGFLRGGRCPATTSGLSVYPAESAVWFCRVENVGWIA